MTKTYYPSPAGRGIGRPSRNMVVGLTALVVLLAAGIVMVVLGPAQSAAPHEIIWLAEKTSRIPGVLPDAARQRFKQAGADGNSRLTVYAIGDRAHRIDSQLLEIKQDNEKVADPGRQAKAVTRKLDGLTKKLADTDVGSGAFSLYAALQSAADEAEKTGGPVEAWLSTTVYTSKVDPLNISGLTVADPTQAVDELMKGDLRKLDLSSVDLHIVLMSPTGEDQQPLNPRSEAWREAFIKVLAEHLHATVEDSLHDNSFATAWPHSAPAGAIVPLPDPSPPPPVSPPPTQSPPRIDNASFVPDHAELLDLARTRHIVRQVVGAYQESHGRYRISVTGYCAKVGGEDGARTLSKQRAETIAGLLHADGVPASDVETHGYGFDQMAEPGQDPKSPAQRVVVISLIDRH